MALAAAGACSPENTKKCTCRSYEDDKPLAEVQVTVVPGMKCSSMDTESKVFGNGGEVLYVRRKTCEEMF